MSLFRKKAEKHTADKKKNVTLETFDGDILLSERLDRRILPDVPDPTGQRASFDRRGVVDDPNDVDAVMKKRKSGIRRPARPFSNHSNIPLLYQKSAVFTSPHGGYP